MKNLQNESIKRMGRRGFLKHAGAGALALGLPKPSWADTLAKPVGANNDVRIAVVGIGSKEAVGGVGGRGRQLIGSLQKVRAARIVALCDVDQSILKHPTPRSPCWTTSRLRSTARSAPCRRRKR